MTDPRIGELFSGYGGLGLGVQSVYGGEVVWHSDIDKGALKILAHRYPDVPNLGDITTVDWSQVEPVDILTGGSPCQDLSHAGKRQGMTEGTRSNLWVAMREAIAVLRPRLVVWENVRGAGSAEATSDLEFCPGCMGDPWYRGTTLRALGRVVGDLSDLGYVGQVRGLRAADVGAPHGRFRYFLAATDSSSGGADAAQQWGRLQGAVARGDVATDAERGGRDGWTRDAVGGAVGGTAPAGRGEVAGTPADPADLGHERTRRARDGRPGPADGGLLPTPRCGAGMSSNLRPHATDTSRLEGAAAANLLPTPRATDGTKGGPNQRSVLYQPWGDYAVAIARWEVVLGRPAPAPTMTSTKGNPQLSAVFVEWMQGLPAGWVTDVPGITRNEALKALGNGVVPQQAEAALRIMAAREAVA